METLYQGNESRHKAATAGAAAMMDRSTATAIGRRTAPPLKISRTPPRVEVPHDDAADRFHFWLIVTLLSIFIMLLFYSQKIQGLM